MRRKIIVLKFGSSVLHSARDLPQAVGEIERWRGEQYGVVAVVSAFNGETDKLLSSVAHYGCGQSEGVARILATGEEIATASLALELERFGITAQVLDASQIQLISESCGHDTEPVDVNLNRIHDVLDSGKVAVMPGFVARDRQGRVSLLGRGGSDLLALFLAKALNAKCRLIKDVDGIFDCDPATSPSARRFDEISFADALLTGAGVVQPKGIAFAERNGIEFEVARVGASDGTRVGRYRSTLCSVVGIGGKA